MKIAFFHGLESPPVSEKNEVLKKYFKNIYAPHMVYGSSNCFEKTLKEVESQKPDLLIGSSMGGWFAYCISTLTGIPTLLFNPAVHSRTIEPIVRIGRKKSIHTVVLGTQDNVISASDTKEWIKKEAIGHFSTYNEKMGHRLPIEIFEKWIVEIDFRLNEEWSTESPGNEPDWSFLPEEVMENLVPTFLSARPTSGSLTVENERESKLVKEICESNTEEDVKFAILADEKPYMIFHDWLKTRGLHPNINMLRSMWEDEKESGIEYIKKLKEKIRRNRPYQDFPYVKKLKEIEPSDFSFPSGHAFGAYHIAHHLSKEYPHLSQPLLDLAKRIAESRVRAGVHYPSDIEAGRLLALMKFNGANM